MIRMSMLSPAALLLAAVALLSGCERPPIDSVQSGYRGTGMVQVYNPRTVAEQIPLNQPPTALIASNTAAVRLAMSGMAPWSRQARMAGPAWGCASNLASHSGCERAKK